MPFSKTVELPLTFGNLGEGQFSFPETIPSIMSLDPGGTTGWAWFNRRKAIIECGQLNGQHHWELLRLLDLRDVEYEVPSEIVYESFQFRQFSGFDKSKIELDSVEYIGVVKLYSQLNEVSIYSQTASVAKHFVSDDKLKRLGWYSRTAGLVHARDALRHLLYRLIVVHKVREPFTNQWLKKVEIENG